MRWVIIGKWKSDINGRFRWKPIKDWFVPITVLLFLLEIYKTQMTHHKSIIQYLNKSQTGYPK